MEQALQEARANGLTTAANWQDYIKEMAEEYGVEYDVAKALFDVSGGPTEAFDGFLTALEYTEFGGY